MLWRQRRDGVLKLGLLRGGNPTNHHLKRVTPENKKSGHERYTRALYPPEEKMVEEFKSN